jgi:plastocyanin
MSTTPFVSYTDDPTNQAVDDISTIYPFAHMNVFSAGEIVTISFNGANGTLTDPNAADDHSVISTDSAGNTLYAVNAGDLSSGELSSFLDALVFTPTVHQVPAGQTVTTVFTITLSGIGIDDSTSVVVTTTGIGGTQANQAVNDNATINPFAHVMIADANPDLSETIHILFNPNNGTLTDPNAASDHSVISSSSYTVTGTPAQVSADLDALVFTPTAHQVAPGGTVTTGFDIMLQFTFDGSQFFSYSDSVTSVVATAAAAPVTISGTQANQAVNDNATIYPFANVMIFDFNDVLTP